MHLQMRVCELILCFENFKCSRPPWIPNQRIWGPFWLEKWVRCQQSPILHYAYFYSSLRKKKSCWWYVFDDSFCIQIGQLVIGQGGIFSTPAVSCIIRKMKATGWNTCLWILIVICIMMLAYPLCSLYWLSLLSINNYPPKWRWILLVDI